MTKLVNRAKMTTATTGTGTISLSGAVDGYQTFADAGVVNSDVVRYVIEDGDAWEIGLGTYSAGTLTRGSIESSNSDLALNLTGNAVVYVSAAAADLQELVDFADNFVLPTADGSTGQVLTTNGAGTLSFTTISGYTDADVDTHLNTGTASSGEVLSWTGSDYDWIAVSAGATDINGLSDAIVNSFSIGLGSGAMPSVGGFRYNTAVGINAGNDVTTAEESVFIGFGAGSKIVSSRWNTVVGARAMQNSVTGGNNTAIGRLALGTGTVESSAGRNVAVGVLAGEDVSTGYWNTFLGSDSGQNVTSGISNTFVGKGSGQNITTGSNNVAIGNGALDAATTGGRNIAIGQDAMGLGAATAASGDNIAIGYQAGYDLTSATGNVLIGLRSGTNLTSGSQSVFVGRDAGASITTAAENTFIGDQSGANITGGSNTAVGHFSLYGGASPSTLQSSAFGYYSGYRVTTGIRNTFLGAVAGFNSTTGVTTGSNNTLVGYASEASSATVSNEITLGNSSIATLRCQVTTITSLSDARDKTDIQPLNAGLEFVEALNPVSFTWNMRDGGKVGEADTGFIAQDLQAAQAKTGVTIPDLVYDVNPDKLEAGYGKLVPVLVQAIKDLSDKVKDLEARLEGK